ncbi:MULTISPECIES: hypothetical protein [Mycobacterium]|uniref:PknH-like extracellular domain-containing protein n=3 Tax=Mycobacterium avium complex (MAC) TaxID=120793 RepID=A0A7R7MX09_MYCIT|nr:MULTISPECIES: hypothetical protein [Mycobacterium]AFC55876.1 hypothetical protein OCQ_43640 [Mycobacterium paraintracellulare]AFJ37197.1 hypothetical protein W7S_21240 [Mycobacterium sp. MOTT36Y]AFS16294.1 Hypothetical protein MIP_06393 [Mycobacterium intracellulare subsp. intracellulare MTCC 9506]ASX02143.1 hypothetical protein CKJ58_20950 [Mycobacterium intracellulare subsp. chimaera]ELR82756.1 hypothetical protein W7U_17105 [Mycobacterium sp. H4Y]
MNSQGRLVPRILLTLVLTLSAAGCGSGTSDSSKTTTATTASTASGAPTQRILSEKALTEALLGVQDLPAGYSQDPPSDRSVDKTFCDYKPAFQEKSYVKRDFTKGGGLSAEFLKVGLRQYADADQARASFKSLTDALATCTGETYNGSNLTYAPMSAPKVAAGSVGVKITADGASLLSFFAVDGPVLINTGGGGLVNANADEVIKTLESQVKKYEALAKS